MFIEILAKRRVYSSQSIKTVNLIDKKNTECYHFKKFFILLKSIIFMKHNKKIKQIQQEVAIYYVYYIRVC